MRRVLIESVETVIVEEVGDLLPGPGEVCVKVAYCGICGSDVHAFKGKHPFISLPATPGHEFSGVISSVGAGVESLKVGDRIVCEPNLVCGTCFNCRAGRYNICDNLRVVGCQGVGAMADYILLPEGKVVPIPDSLSLRSAVFVEPLAVGVHAVRRAGDLFGKNVVVFGAGTIGLAVILCAKLAGAKRITAVDLLAKRLALSKKLGATDTVNAAVGNTVQKILSQKPFEGVDVVFECVGVEKSIRDSMAVVRKGGKVIVAGVFGSETNVKMADLQDREMELIGTIMYVRRDVVDAIDLLAGGVCDADDFITAEYPLPEAKKAFAVAENAEKNVKVIFQINPENRKQPS
jgi:L-iditol 2-dehydrogenase